MPSTIDTDGPEVLVDLRLSPDLTSPARARHALNPIEERFGDEASFKLRLLISELVTNSVKHARLRAQDHIAIRVVSEGKALRAEVVDRGLGLPAPERSQPEGRWQYRQSEPDPDWPGGWGLSIVETLADRWGVVQDDHTMVWFEVAVAEEE
jgi:anti-sigma regulatory factor (Ser/Thr protein kinase)